MAARKKASRKRSRTRRAARGGALRTTVLRLERELPPGVRRLVVRTRRRLSALEAQAARAQAKYQRQAAKLLRQARSDRAWKKLDAQARRRVRQLLQRLEKAIG